MDMKRILQALDKTSSTQPVEGASDMKKFMQVVTEGANPHKVSLPVQMAMQHYQPNQVTQKTTVQLKFKQFLEEVNFEKVQEQLIQDQRIKEHSKKIANRVLMKESELKDKEDLQAKRKALQDIQLDPSTDKDPELKKELIRRKASLEKEAKEKHLSESPIELIGDPNDPMIYGHQKANPMSLKGRIMQARAQLKDLAQAAESNDLAVWQDICAKAKGGMFMGLEQNLEQIRHGIAELAAKRKKGGVQSRGIDKNIGQ